MATVIETRIPLEFRNLERTVLAFDALSSLWTEDVDHQKVSFLFSILNDSLQAQVEQLESALLK